MSLLLTKKNIAIASVILIIVALGWFLTTDNIKVWPVRHVLQYRLLTWWSGPLQEPDPNAPSGTLVGTVRDSQNRPLENVWVVIPHRSGATFSGRTAADGRYTIESAPTGVYYPVAGAPGYKSTTLGDAIGAVVINPDAITHSDVTLLLKRARSVAPGQNLTLSEPGEIACKNPLKVPRSDVRCNSLAQGRKINPLFTIRP